MKSRITSRVEALIRLSERFWKMEPIVAESAYESVTTAETNEVVGSCLAIGFAT
jgi:hypothetical protein